MLSLTKNDDKLCEGKPLQSKEEESPTTKREKKTFVIPTLSQPFDVLEATKFFFNASSPPISGGGSSGP